MYGGAVKLLAVTVLSVLTLAGTAKADHGESVTDPLVVGSLQIAADHWGQEKLCAHVALANLPDPLWAAIADAELCAISLAPSHWHAPEYPRSEWCQVIVHEYGHLLGHTHDDPNPIMQNAWAAGLVPACSHFDRRRFVKGRPVELQRVARRPMGRRALARPRTASR